MVLPAGNHEWLFHPAEFFDTHNLIRTMGTEKSPGNQPGHLVYTGSKIRIEMTHGNHRHLKVFVPCLKPLNKLPIKKNQVLRRFKIPIVTSAYLCRQTIRSSGKDE